MNDATNNSTMNADETALARRLVGLVAYVDGQTNAAFDDGCPKDREAAAWYCHEQGLLAKSDALADFDARTRAVSNG